jgi:hypothetical protein
MQRMGVAGGMRLIFVARFRGTIGDWGTHDLMMRLPGS